MFCSSDDIIGEPEQPMTDHDAHIAGAVVGFFTSIVFLRFGTLKSYRTGAKAIWWYSLLILLELFFAAIVMNIFGITIELLNLSE